MTLENQRPDFLIIGAPTRNQGEEGVILVASNDLKEVELQERYEVEVSLWDMRVISDRPRLSHIELSGELMSYVIVFGKTYQEAFTRLMTMGDPTTWGRQTREIQPPVKQLSPAEPVDHE